MDIWEWEVIKDVVKDTCISDADKMKIALDSKDLDRITNIVLRGVIFNLSQHIQLTITDNTEDNPGIKYGNLDGFIEHR